MMPNLLVSVGTHTPQHRSGTSSVLFGFSQKRVMYPAFRGWAPLTARLVERDLLEVRFSFDVGHATDIRPSASSASRRHCRLEVIEWKVTFACAFVHNVPPERSPFAVPQLKPLVGKDDPTIVEVGGTDAEVAALKLESRLKSLRLEVRRRVFS